MSRFSPNIKGRIYSKKGTICTYCYQDISKLPTFQQTLEHVIPVSDGGTNDESNLEPCCRACNILRGNWFTVEETRFMAKYRHLYKSYKYKNQNKKRSWDVILDEIMMMYELVKEEGKEFVDFDQELIARAKKAVAAREAKKVAKKLPAF